MQRVYTGYEIVYQFYKDRCKADDRSRRHGKNGGLRKRRRNGTASVDSERMMRRITSKRLLEEGRIRMTGGRIRKNALKDVCFALCCVK